MGWFDALLGRSSPPPADLDVLFAVPQAALSLETAGFTPTGQGAVCFRDAEGAVDDRVVAEAERLVSTDPTAAVTVTDDGRGYRWFSVSRPVPQTSALATDLHAVNRSLVDAGFGAGLLCSTVGFRTDGDRPCALVYLFKQGTFYPFVPTAEGRRDNAAELRIRGLVEGDVPVEAKLERWLALWGAPGLQTG